MTDLGDFPGDPSYQVSGIDNATAHCYWINDAGQILVTGWTNPLAKRPPPPTILWQAGRRKDLGQIDPYAFNNRGQIAGYDAHEHIILWGKGRTRRLPLAPSARLGYANCPNDRGWLVGEIGRGGPGTYAFLWDGRHVRRVSPPGALSARAEAVNDRGQDLVWVEPQSGPNEVFLWSRGRSALIGGIPHALPNRQVFDLNDRGQALIVAGSATRRGVFLWQSGRLRRVKPPPGMDHENAVQVDNQGRMVGAAGTVTRRAIPWDGDRSIDLNTRLPFGSGWKLRDAEGINGRGQIVERACTEVGVAPIF